MLGRFDNVVCLMALLVPIAYAQVRGPDCYKVVIPVTISGKNIKVPREGLSIVNSTNILSGLVNSLFSTISPIDGTYQIAGRYCEPEVTIARRRDTLQLLVHPATYDRNYVRLPPSTVKSSANICSGLVVDTLGMVMRTNDIAGLHMHHMRDTQPLQSTG